MIDPTDLNVSKRMANGTDLIRANESGVLDPETGTVVETVLSAMIPALLRNIENMRELTEEE